MRLIVYNIAYGTGSPGAVHKRVLASLRYLKTPNSHFQEIIEFCKTNTPDIVGLVEVDLGSFRTKKINQAQQLANHLNHFHVCGSKYGQDSYLRKIPFLRHHANAIISSCREEDSRLLYFNSGVKKLVIESKISGIHFFLVHLALGKKVRQQQLEQLELLLPHDKPVILAGDFNTLQGEAELDRLMKKCKLKNPNYNACPTYPAWKPKKQLDYILCSEHIKIKKFSVAPVELSDHLPLILDFEV